MKNNPTNENFEKQKSKKFQKLLKTNFFFLFFIKMDNDEKIFYGYLKFIF